MNEPNFSGKATTWPSSDTELEPLRPKTLIPKPPSLPRGLSSVALAAKYFKLHSGKLLMSLWYELPSRPGQARPLFLSHSFFVFYGWRSHRCGSWLLLCSATPIAYSTFIFFYVLNYAAKCMNPILNKETQHASDYYLYNSLELSPVNSALPLDCLNLHI